MTTEQLKQLQSILEDAKYSVQQLQNYYGKVIDDDNDSHQEGYGLLTTADYALDDFQDKLSNLSKLEE